MNLEVLKIMEKSVSAIVAFETSTLKPVSENDRATELLSINGATLRLSTLFFSKEKAEALLLDVKKNLETQDKYRIWDTEVMGNQRKAIPADLEFSYVTPDKTHMFLKVRPILDNKTYYLEKFIETRKRPAFTMNKNGDFIVGIGNDIFYKSFACNKETISTRYKNEFVRFLREDARKDDEEKIRQAIAQQPSGILDIPIQTAYGDTLWFYYDTKKLRQLEKDDTGNLMFCLLVSKEDTIEQLDDPFDL